MTLKNIILEQTGMRTPQFCEHFGYKEATITSWSLPQKSKAARNPKLKSVRKLALDMKLQFLNLALFFEDRWYL